MGLEETKWERREKANQLHSIGVDPYPYKYVRSYSADQILKQFNTLIEHEMEVTLAGRVLTRRDHGKTAFMNIIDASGTVQIYIRQDLLQAANYRIYQLLDIGDFIGVRGKVFRTKTGEPTVQVLDLQILCKSLRVLPDKWHGLKDVELRYRQRYLDLIMNPEVRKVFVTRTRIINIIRHVFNSKGGLEVETPTLQPLYGGASARPFKTHHNALDSEFYLRIADELYLKRLIVGGFECVYEICKDFRNEGMDRSHNPEFTMVEIYWAYKDYKDMMDLTEELFVSIAQEVAGSMIITYQGQELNLTPPWPRRGMLDLVKEYTGIDVVGLTDDELREVLAQELHREGSLEADSDNDGRDINSIGIELEGLNRGNMIEELFSLRVERDLIQPIFVTDYPKETSPLAKVHRHNPALTERFELYIVGREMANAFSELNDPIDQRERFEAQMRQMEAGDEEAQLLDEDFLRALEYGMPPTGGLGIGVDRLVMLFTNQSSIQDVMLFPQMRPEPGLYESVHQSLRTES
jgi:lysyl-tRNA synthetase class 2